MELKDYLHLYFGCDCICSLWDLPGGDYITKVQWPELQHPQRVKKLILRPLSDMTNEEKYERGGVLLQKYKHTNTLDAEYTRYNISKGFDVFNLIDAGLAIDAKEVENAK